MFAQTKDGMVGPTLSLFNKWKGTPRNVTHLRMDNAGENKKLQTACESAEWNIGIKKYKCTLCNTPQQNLLVQVAFNTIGSQAKALLSDTNIPDSQRHLLFPRAVLLATNLDGLIPVTVGGVTASWYKHLLEYGIARTKFQILCPWYQQLRLYEGPRVETLCWQARGLFERCSSVNMLQNAADCLRVCDGS